MPFRIFERLRVVRHNPQYSTAAGLSIFGAGFLLRYVPGGVLESVPFITLFPAILLAALVGGLRIGLLVAVLSFFAGWYFFLPPHQSFAFEDGRTAWALVFFWVTAGILLFVIEALNRALDGLATE